jgi:3-hydroxyisobutyrate dehydrogenase-like beta-hydroxyacid dehydrogenase
VSEGPLGFIGLGNMGGPMAARLAAAGFGLVAYDAAGTPERAPAGTRCVESCAEVAAAAATVLLSLPDARVVREVAAEIAAAADRATDTVVDFSTIGIGAARATHELLAAAGVTYVDAPVSGGSAGAKAGTLAVMAAADEASFARLGAVFDAVSAKAFRVGAEAGQGQAMKLLNNFLSATAMAATSEAVAFGERQGLEPETMISVLNAATGRNSATSDKFPNRILPGSFDAGFATALMAKDVALYLDGVAAAGTMSEVAAAVGEVWRGCERALPDSDFTRVYSFVRGDAGGA